jgi:hypothetical protein
MKARKVVHQVKQHDLKDIERLRAFKSRLTKELTTIEALLEAREVQVMNSMAAGGRVQAGEYVAELGEKTVCNPKYKDELVAHFELAHGIAGKLVEEEVKKRYTKTKPVLTIVRQVHLGVVR